VLVGSHYLVCIAYLTSGVLGGSQTLNR